MGRIKKRYIIIGISIFALLIILNIIIGFYWRAKCDQTMELFGTALINRDLDLLDTLIDRECDMGPAEGLVRQRQYHYQRGVIAEIWETKEYTINLYHYEYIGSPYAFWSIRLGSSILVACEFRIIDISGKEYRLLVTMIINRMERGRIVSTDAYLDRDPTRWGF